MLTLNATPALARGFPQDDPDPAFHLNDDAEPNSYIVLLADGSYTPPSDMQTAPVGAQTNAVRPGPAPLAG